MQSESDSVNPCFLCCRREAKNDVIAVLGFWWLEFWELDELPYATISVTLPGHPYRALLRVSSQPPHQTTNYR
jgi:hypothetical protein